MSESIYQRWRPTEAEALAHARRSKIRWKPPVLDPNVLDPDTGLPMWRLDLWRRPEETRARLRLAGAIEP